MSLSRPTAKRARGAEAFYGEKLGFRKLFRFGQLSFYDLAGVRLFLDGVREGGRAFAPSASVLYFRTADIGLTRRELEGRGVRSATSRT